MEDSGFMELIAVAKSRYHQRVCDQSGLAGIERWRTITKASDEDLNSVATHFPERMCCAVHRVG